jgi:hypothetical protein
MSVEPNLTMETCMTSIGKGVSKQTLQSKRAALLVLPDCTFDHIPGVSRGSTGIVPLVQDDECISS